MRKSLICCLVLGLLAGWSADCLYAKVPVSCFFHVSNNGTREQRIRVLLALLNNLTEKKADSVLKGNFDGQLYQRYPLKAHMEVLGGIAGEVNGSQIEKFLHEPTSAKVFLKTPAGKTPVLLVEFAGSDDRIRGLRLEGQ